jgi:hypothetical protein
MTAFMSRNPNCLANPGLCPVTLKMAVNIGKGRGEVNAEAKS